jgi:monovalent cation:H+ antiporter, CPA1 family
MQSTFHIDLLVIFLTIAAAVGIAVKWIKVPYPIALVIVGLIIGLGEFLPGLEMTPDLILLLCLPALLFEASWNLDLSELRANALPIGIFATFGVIITMLICGMGMHAFTNLSLSGALLFGAMIAATDPISVIALFRKLGISKRLTLLIEGESLFNDGVAVVLFQLMLGITLAGTVPSIPKTIVDFLLSIIGGAGVGCTLGFGASRLIRLFDDHLLEIMLTTIVAYGSYLTAEQFHVSPVLAVVSAGIVLGNYGSHTSMSPSTRLAVNSFWEYAAFVVNSLVFLLIGLQIKFEMLSHYLTPLAVAIPLVLVARAIAIYSLSLFLRKQPNYISWRWRHILVWGGLRGALCMALALSLPLNFQERDILVVLTFGVVLFTLLVPGLTIESFAKFLKISKPNQAVEDHQRLKAQIVMNVRALDYISQLQRTRTVSDVVCKLFHDQLVDKQHQLTRQMEEIHLTDESLRNLEEVTTKRHLLELQKNALADLIRSGVITEESAEQIRVDLDRRIHELSW